MTDIATQTPAWPSTDWDSGTVERLPARQISQGERMREWLHLFKECREAAEVLARTSFVPKDMQGKPAEIATSMLKGWELGLDPLDALASIYVVHGRVGFYAEFMRRRIIQAGHIFRVVESNDTRCIVEGTRADNGETHRAVFTAEQAKRAKIDIAAYPNEKLVARATSRLCKQAFPDVLSGALIVEDLMDGVVTVESQRVDPVDSDQPMSAGATVQRKRQPRAVKAKPEPKPAPVVDDDLLDDPVLETPSESRAKPEPAQVDRADDDDLLDDSSDPDGPATREQNATINGLFKDAGVSDRDAKKHVIRTLIGYEINLLTEAEADTVITKLQAWKTADALTEQVWQIVDPPEAVEMITDAQKTKLAIQRDERYPKTTKGRAQWFAWVAEQISREVASNTELTKTEAHTLIDLLTPEQEPPTTTEGN